MILRVLAVALLWAMAYVAYPFLNGVVIEVLSAGEFGRQYLAQSGTVTAAILALFGTHQTWGLIGRSAVLA